LECTSNTTCSKCITENMYFNTTVGRCELCELNCLNCSNSITCNKCVLNFYPETQGNSTVCVYCLTNECLECTSPTVCKTCNEGFTLVDGYCLLCSAIIPGCENCTYNATTKNATCSLCVDGFILANTICNLCPQNCGKCLNSSFCAICDPGFTTNLTTGECQPAAPNCLYAPDTTICLTCVEGYYKNQNTCLPC